MQDACSYMEFADDRTKSHSGHTQRVLSEAHDMSGEFAFGEFSGLFPDTSILIGGIWELTFTSCCRSRLM